MSTIGQSWWRQLLLPFSLGIADGIVNALTLAGGAVLHGTGLTLGLGLRVGAVAWVTAIFTVFVAEYAQLRAGLVRAAQELNLLSSGRIAASQLGRDVLREAGLAAVVASLCGFLGAFAPLVIGSVTTPYNWSALVVSVLGLACLGAGLAAAVQGSRLRWMASMTVMGILVAVIGVALDIT